MLSFLHIQNFALIDNLELDFASGMSAITGETGAGKSIILQALNLALGHRCQTKFTKPCNITAHFDISALNTVQHFLANHELECENECILRRNISPDGRSKAFINDHSVSLATLKQLGQLLVHYHGQSEHYQLQKSDVQLKLIDDYADLTTLASDVRALCASWHEQKRAIEQLQTHHSEHQAKLDLLQYQVTELENLQLQENEWASLYEEHKTLTHAIDHAEQYQLALTALEGSTNPENSAINQLAHVLQLLPRPETPTPQLTDTYKMLDEAQIHLTEAASELSAYLSTINVDPARLREVDARLNTLHDVSRKHHVEPEQLHELHTELQKQLHGLLNQDATLAELANTQHATFEKYQNHAKTLSTKRQKASKTLSKAVQAFMQELGMDGGLFTVSFTPESTDMPHPFGLEKVEFLASPNPGHAQTPLSKLSGGELSRLSLAISVMTSEQYQTTCVIFDEVDVGIGGGTAEVVGKLLRELAAQAQVICITHLAQVASQAHHHFCVKKEKSKTQTTTYLRQLSKSERIDEIARMLGGTKITEQTRSHSAEMLAQADEA